MNVPSAFFPKFNVPYVVAAYSWLRCCWASHSPFPTAVENLLKTFMFCGCLESLG